MLLGWSMKEVNLSLTDLFVDGIPNMYALLQDMVPPAVNDLPRIGWALLETIQIAVIGAVVGFLLSFPLAILATRNFTPHILCFHVTRLLIQLFRVVPAIIWAVIFVASVGLGAFAGALTLVVSTIGFCGRFFAEAMDDVDTGPQEALAALGSTRIGIIFSAVFPAAMPSFLNTMSFAFERSVRSSAILGLVGAGGIGFILTESMEMFMWPRAATIMMSMLVLVLVVEKGSAYLRKQAM